MSLQMMENGKKLESNYSSSSFELYPHLPQDLRSLWIAKNTPGPHPGSGQNSARSNLPSSILYFDHLDCGLGPSAIIHPLLFLFEHESSHAYRQ